MSTPKILSRLKKLQEARKEEPSIDDALLRLRFFSYARHRLRYLLLSHVAVVTVNTLEFLLLRKSFPSQQLLWLILFQTAATLAVSFYWGYLEPFRSEVHRLYRLGLRADLAQWLAGWLAVTRRCSQVIFALGLSVIAAYALGRHGSVATLGFAIGVMALRAAVEIQLRYRNSIVFALRRTYRPVWLTLLIEATALGVTFATVAWLGPIAFALGSFLGLVISTSVSLYYNRSALRSLKIPQFSKRRSLRSVRHVHDKFLKAQWASGLASLSTRVGSLIVLLSFSSPERVSFFHVLSPILAGSAFWPQTFHFDLRRFADPAFQGLRESLHRKLLGTSFWVSLILLVSAAGALTAAGFESKPLAWAALWGVLLLRSRLAAMNLVRFVHRSYGSVMLSGGVLVAGILSIHPLLFRIPAVVTGAWDLWTAELCAFALTYLISMIPLFLARNQHVESGLSGLVSAPEFVARASHDPTQGVILRVTIAKRRLVYYRCLEWATQANLRVFREDSKRLWLSGTGDAKQLRERLLIALCGWVENFEILRPEQLRDLTSLRSDTNATLGRLKVRFEKEFPGQAYWCAGEPIHAPPGTSRALTQEWFKRVCMSLDYLKPKKSEWEVIPWLTHGQLRAFFVLNTRQTSFEQRQSFRTAIHAESVQRGARSASTTASTTA
jgi:hypothetical protein